MITGSILEDNFVTETAFSLTGETRQSLIIDMGAGEEDLYGGSYETGTVTLTLFGVTSLSAAAGDYYDDFS